jgi:tRNA threonylcarbamoyladenosine biosynthesis protein TsaE
MKLICEIMYHSLEETRVFAKKLTAYLKIGDVLALDGDLGAGKTEFSRALIHGFGFNEDVPSPTFNLLQIYEPDPKDQKTPTIWHFDLYRLEQPEEAFELGIEDAFEGGLSLIEWPSRLGTYLPSDMLAIYIKRTEKEGARKFILAGGDKWQKKLENL